MSGFPRHFVEPAGKLIELPFARECGGTRWLTPTPKVRLQPDTRFVVRLRLSLVQPVQSHTIADAADLSVREVYLDHIL